MRKNAFLLGATAFALIDPFAMAAAQDAVSSPSTSQAYVDQNDIIVTARRRQESVLKVPVVESVLNTAALEKAQITDIRGVTSRVPGLIIGDNVLSIGAQISLRGIGTSALDAGIDQSVSLNIDGLQFSQGLAFKSGLFDLAQAEVLKGPQALFFGKNSPGGVIALTTADPGPDAEIIARAIYGFVADEQRYELIVSNALTDTFGLRLAGAWSDSKGYFNNRATPIPGTGALAPAHDRGFSNKGLILRGTAVWEPTDDFRARLKVNLTKDKSDSPTNLQMISCPNGTGPSVLGIQFLSPDCKMDRNYALVSVDPAAFPGTMQDGSPGVRNDGQPFTDIKQNFGTLELNYNVAPDTMLTSTTGFYHNTTDTMTNGVMTAQAGPTLFADNHFTRQDFTQELRLESDNQGRAFNWMLGGYYQNADVKNRIFVGGNTFYGLPAILTAGSHDLDIESASLFGQLRWKPVEVVELTGGVRWTDEERSDDPVSRNPLTGAYVPVAIPSPEISSKNWSPEFTITWTPTDDLTVFGALKQGYKSGSYSITTPATTGVDNSFGDEKVQGGEVGLKSRFMDRTFNFNAAFYYYRYKGLQVGVSQPADLTGVPVLRTLNAGKAETYGIDMDATWSPNEVPGLSLNLSVNWNKAKYLELDNVPCYGGQTIALGCNQAFNATKTSPLLPGVMGFYTGQSATGEALERAPEWQALGGVDYDTDLTSNFKLTVGTSVQYSDRYKLVIGPRDDYWQDSYAKLNAYVTLRDANDGWELSLIGNNLTDTIRAGYCANSDFQNTTVFTNFAQVTGYTVNPTGKTDDVGCAVQPGREVFLRLTLRPLGLLN